IITTDDIVVSPQIAGQISRLDVHESDTVKKDQLLAVIRPDELRAESAVSSQNAEASSSQVRESEAALRLQQMQTTDQIRQAEATMAAIESQVTAAAADLESAKLTYTRTNNLFDQKVASQQEIDQARTAAETAQAKVDALKKQADAQRSTVALAKSNAEQVAV